MQRPRVRKGPTVVSGSQTGVDRAALGTALALGIAVGLVPGGAPRGGRHPPRALSVAGDPGRRRRGRGAWNLRASDATLVLHRGTPDGGTRLTAELARRLGRPLLCRDLSQQPGRGEVVHWLGCNRVRRLKCAGP